MLDDGGVRELWLAAICTVVDRIMPSSYPKGNSHEKLNIMYFRNVLSEAKDCVGGTSQSGLKTRSDSIRLAKLTIRSNSEYAYVKYVYVALRRNRCFLIKVFPSAAGNQSQARGSVAMPIFVPISKAVTDAKSMTSLDGTTLVDPSGFISVGATSGTTITGISARALEELGQGQLTSQVSLTLTVKP